MYATDDGERERKSAMTDRDTGQRRGFTAKESTPYTRKNRPAGPHRHPARTKHFQSSKNCCPRGANTHSSTGQLRVQAK